MFDYLQSLDEQIVYTINALNSSLLDKLMWMISAKTTWIPLYLLLIYLAFRKFQIKTAILFIVCVLVAIGCTDFICSGLIKNWVMRPRPSHHPLLSDLLHYHQFADGSFYKGGAFGFVSSHAGNFFALAWMVGWSFRAIYPQLLFYLLLTASLIAYSRLYLGVHYLSDLLGGFLVGTIVAFVVFRCVYRPLKHRLN